MKRLRQVGRFLCSMKCAIILLLILTAACTVGSFIPQGQESIYYTANYPESLSGLILFLGLGDVFHCWWFVGLTIFLCVNLMCCNVLRFPGLVKKQREGFSITQYLSSCMGQPVGQWNGDPKKLFDRLGFRKVKEVRSPEGMLCLYAEKNRQGIWGAWLCHLGMLVIIAGFGLGQIFQIVYTVYGVPGQVKPIGDSQYDMKIEDFSVQLRADATVEQYMTEFTVCDRESGDQYSGTTMVNSPAAVKGMSFYQNSTGWAATVDVLKDGKKLQEELLCAGEFLRVSGKEDLAVVFSAFYPDYGQDENGKPVTLTPGLRNPGYLYTLYYKDRVLGMNVLTGDQVISVEDYTFVFHDPQQYTLIQIKKDPFRWLAAIGGLLVVAALILAFYMCPAEMWAIERKDGVWDVAGRSRKNGELFLERIRQEMEKEEIQNGK